MSEPQLYSMTFQSDSNSAVNHAVLCKISPPTANSAGGRVTIFNSGEGLPEQSKLHGVVIDGDIKKAPTALVIDLPERLDHGELRKVLADISSVKSLYDWANTLVSLGAQVKQSNVEELQTQQKAYNCATEAWNAVFKHELGPEDYLEFRLNEFKALRFNELDKLHSGEPVDISRLKELDKKIVLREFKRTGHKTQDISDIVRLTLHCSPLDKSAWMAHSNGKDDIAIGVLTGLKDKPEEFRLVYNALKELTYGHLPEFLIKAVRLDVITVTQLSTIKSTQGKSI